MVSVYAVLQKDTSEERLREGGATRGRGETGEAGDDVFVYVICKTSKLGGARLGGGRHTIS